MDANEKYRCELKMRKNQNEIELFEMILRRLERELFKNRFEKEIESEMKMKMKFCKMNKMIKMI